MKRSLNIFIAAMFCLLALLLTMSKSTTPVSAGSTTHDPTWWDKYQFILNSGSDAAPGSTSFLMEEVFTAKVR
jgi:hypothetical protein